MNLRSILTSTKSSNFKTMIVAAHYDDETISMGSRFPYLGKIYFVHTTNSSPANLNDALNNGFQDAESYHQKRKDEFEKALSCCGLNNYECFESGIKDQESSFHIKHLINFLSNKILDINPDIIFTHSYEGGHPDHDTASFIVNRACKNCSYNKYYEYSSYFSDTGNISTCKFLNKSTPETIIFPSEEEIVLKKMMLSCFLTQRETIKYFCTDKELFRPAPEYNYLSAPHSGQLFYEKFDWGITGERWRQIVNENS